MRTVHINKGDLVNALTENRKKHKADFETACKGYREYMVTELERAVIRLKAGENVELRFDYDKPPEDHSEEYDVALKMMEMSVEQTIELSDQEFRQLILDDWQWRRTWDMANMKYLTFKR